MPYRPLQRSNSRRRLLPITTGALWLTLSSIGFGLGAGLSGPLRAAPGGVRSLFLNGVDISSAKSQDLKNVDLHISENGDVFIIAAHYQVNEEDNYVPLSKYMQGVNAPETRSPSRMVGTLRGEARVPAPLGGAKAPPQALITPAGGTTDTPLGGLMPKAGAMMPISPPALPPDSVLEAPGGMPPASAAAAAGNGNGNAELTSARSMPANAAGGANGGSGPAAPKPAAVNPAAALGEADDAGGEPPLGDLPP